MRILYLDDALVAVDKPSGLAVHRGWDGSSDVAMMRVRDLLGRYVWPVHRLDRGASGALLFAVERDAARALHAMFARGEVRKRYLLLVRGTPPEAGEIDHPIPRTERGPRVDSVTAYRRLGVVERDDLPRSYALVEASPRTGRLHQIRRHFKHISHPLIGDVRYGKGEHNRLFREQFGLNRLFLHASSLSFTHPLTSAPIEIPCSLPDDLAEVLRALDLEGVTPAEGTP